MDLRKLLRGSRRRVIGIALLVVTVLMVLLAYQSISTDQYRLYSRNYSYYVSKAEECRALQDTGLGAHYAYLAGEWETTARLAKDYLREHNLGAGALGVAGLIALAAGLRMLIPGRKKEQS